MNDDTKKFALKITGCAGILLTAVLTHAPLSRYFALPANLGGDKYAKATDGGAEAASTLSALNIVFILTDQEHYMGTSYPAGTDFKGRERLRNMSTTFEKHYICSAMSTSSRSVIYTGRHITYTKMFDNTDMDYMYSMNPKLTTIGDMMRGAGYYTAYKGKLHLAGSGVHDDTWHTIFNTTNRLEPYGFSDWNPDGDTPGGVEEGYSTDGSIAAAATDWLRGTGAKKNAAGQPFFLAVNLINPHDIMYFNTDLPGVMEQDTGKLFAPIKRAPDNEFYKTTYPLAPIPLTYSEDIKAAGRVNAHNEYYRVWGSNVGVVPARADNWERFRDYYYNCIKDCDNQLVKILDEL
ncbi:MAG: sulfatase-like hydrolase/transferase, partial [Synergistaceae bacterium]|nr:sulfatase-like hydrolase/transferase [Synergistaceae bacterium]